MLDEMCIREIRGYLDREGLLTQLPVKKKKKLIALCYLVDRIPEGKIYTEREFNTLLNTLHTFGDPATLRRELFDCYLIDQEKDGTGYRLAPDRPDVKGLIEKYCLE